MHLSYAQRQLIFQTKYYHALQQNNKRVIHIDFCNYKNKGYNITKQVKSYLAIIYGATPQNKTRPRSAPHPQTHRR